VKVVTGAASRYSLEALDDELQRAAQVVVELVGVEQLAERALSLAQRRRRDGQVVGDLGELVVDLALVDQQTQVALPFVDLGEMLSRRFAVVSSTTSRPDCPRRS
jgi:hypothetical protein